MLGGRDDPVYEGEGCDCLTRQFGERKKSFNGVGLWVRDFALSTGGFEEEHLEMVDRVLLIDIKGFCVSNPRMFMKRVTGVAAGGSHGKRKDRRSHHNGIQ